jgi:hypothetical protein
MRRRRIAAGTAAALAIAELGIAGATPASATLNTCATINSVQEVVNPSPMGASFSATVDFVTGDPLSVTWSNIVGSASDSVLQVPTSRAVDIGTPTETLSYTIPSEYAGIQEFTATLDGEFISATLTITCGVTSTTASSGIPPWVQAYGIFHQRDACETGWGNSWQKWAEPITGGWVCTRTIPSLG